MGDARHPRPHALRSTQLRNHATTQPPNYAPRPTDLMIPTTLSRSLSVIEVPLGMHKPLSKISSDTDPPTARHFENTGCMCMGFQIGRDSMFSFSRARRTCSRVAPKSLGSMRMQVSQNVLRQPGASGMKEMPGRSLNAAR